MISKSSIRQLLKYDPLTGEFTRQKSSRNGRWKKGSKVGRLLSNNCGKNYICTNINGGDYLLHRLAFLYMTGEFPSHQVDHINGDGTDNRWINLRAVTHRENSMNTKRRIDNKSGVCGVSWDKSRKKWTARIKAYDGRYLYLGRFSNINDAAKSRKEAEKDHGYHEFHGQVKEVAC